MSSFAYSAMKTEWQIDVSKNGIKYSAGGKSEEIPMAILAGCGVGLTAVNQNAINMLSNYMKWKKDPNPDKYLDRELSPDHFREEGKSGYGTMPYLIVAKQGGEKKSAIYLPVNFDDPNCLAMLKAVQSELGNKYLGFGYDVFLKYALGVSNNMPFFLMAVGMLGLFLFFTIMMGVLS
jgi:hypothetical protein